MSGSRRSSRLLCFVVCGVLQVLAFSGRLERVFAERLFAFLFMFFILVLYLLDFVREIALLYSVRRISSLDVFRGWPERCVIVTVDRSEHVSSVGQ